MVMQSQETWNAEKLDCEVYSTFYSFTKSKLDFSNSNLIILDEAQNRSWFFYAIKIVVATSGKIGFSLVEDESGGRLKSPS